MLLPAHISDFQKFLFENTKKDDDLAIAYFRKLFGNKLKRENAASGADGYVQGHFVLEVKSKKSDWYKGLFQGLAYSNKGLAFTSVVVVAKQFIALWQVDDIPIEIIQDIAQRLEAPNELGPIMARKYGNKKDILLRKASWTLGDNLTELFTPDQDLFSKAIASFKDALLSGRKVRQHITTKNFLSFIKEMKQFFDPTQPIKTVTAFYIMIYGPWNDTSVVFKDPINDDCVSLCGAHVSNLIPSMRGDFKTFVENHTIRIGSNESLDDFFSHYDKALDIVDPQFRKTHGIYFTDLDLSKFVMWFVKQHIPNLGRDYLVIDPACGSGNLVTNWRSPLELRHKVVSEIEPELLSVVEQRMKGDHWHNGKFTVVPKVTENVGLNFIDKPASQYLSIIQDYLYEKDKKLDKPIAFLCNPPYRSDDDQAAGAISYKVDPDILDMIGQDAASERYCCFLAQMKLICQAVVDSDVPHNSVLMLFTKAAWLTKRPVFQQIRRQMLGVFEDIGGILIDGSEFFDLRGKFPIAFTMWRYMGPEANLNPDRSIPLIDLTDLSKKELKEFPWGDAEKLNQVCNEVLARNTSIGVHIGTEQECIRNWVGQTRLDFMRNRRQGEKEAGQHVGGLPLNDLRLTNKKAYGESDGKIVGFMDDLTPCRTRKGQSGVPWFRLNPQFMDVRRMRCCSGPVDHFGYHAGNGDTFKMFAWFALGRTFAQCGYPMWVDALELWAPEIPPALALSVQKLVYSIGFAENACVEIVFPAGNPVQEAVEVYVNNPMTPTNPDSFWSKHMAVVFNSKDKTVSDKLIQAVARVFDLWLQEFHGRAEIIAEYKRPYFIGEGRLTKGAGLTQIKDYASATHNEDIQNAIKNVQELLKEAKKAFYELLISESGINYFGPSKQQVQVREIVGFKPKTKFDHTLEKRIALAATLINESTKDPNFGVIKFVKLFYLAESLNQLNLETQYYREAAGPLDQRALYNGKVGLLELGRRHSYFETKKEGLLTKFVPMRNLDLATAKAKEIFGGVISSVCELVNKCHKLDTEQSEIVATLFACWNDLLLRSKKVTEDDIVAEFLDNWHPSKTRFAKKTLLKALKWMKDQKIVPTGRAKETLRKPQENSE